jgi:hypothetical protein
MIRSDSFVSAAMQAKIGKYGRLALMAILVAAGLTVLGVGGAQQARAEPPDPCHHGCGY